MGVCRGGVRIRGRFDLGSFQGWILYYYVQATSVFATMLWHRPPFFCLLHQPMHKTSSQSGTCLYHTVWSTPSWAPKHAILDGCSTVVRVIRALGLDGLELWVVRGVEHSDYCNRSHFDKSALSFATRALFLSLQIRVDNFHQHFKADFQAK